MPSGAERPVVNASRGESFPRLTATHAIEVTRHRLSARHHLDPAILDPAQPPSRPASDRPRRLSATVGSTSARTASARAVSALDAVHGSGAGCRTSWVSRARSHGMTASRVMSPVMPNASG